MVERRLSPMVVIVEHCLPSVDPTQWTCIDLIDDYRDDNSL